MKKLNIFKGNFVKERESFPYYIFSKPWTNKEENVLPRLEIFFNKKLTLEDDPITMIEEV